MSLHEFGEGLLYSNVSYVIFRVYFLIQSFIFTLEYKTLNPMQKKKKLVYKALYSALNIFYLKGTVHPEI